jgi:hypothetical protein
MMVPYYSRAAIVANNVAAARRWVKRSSLVIGKSEATKQSRVQIDWIASLRSQ